MKITRHRKLVAISLFVIAIVWLIIAFIPNLGWMVKMILGFLITAVILHFFTKLDEKEKGGG